MTVFTLSRAPVDSHDEQFFKVLGERIASARKVRHLTQQQLADQLGIAQQTLANYEGGHRPLLASTLFKLAETFGLTVDELLRPDIKPKAKRGPAPKLQKQVERINQLPKAKQQLLMEMLDGVLAQVGH